MATGIVNPVLTQTTFRSPVQVQITFTLTGAWPDFIQVYAQQAGSQVGNIVPTELIQTFDWQPPNPEGLFDIKLPGGEAFSIWLCPRNGSSPDDLDDDYANDYWEDSCTNAGNITTQVLQTPTEQPTKPYIVSYQQQPATLTGNGSITISWVSSSYNKFLIRYSSGGQLITQGEVDPDTPSRSATSGSWTTNQSVKPGLVYEFVVEGGNSQGLFVPPIYSGWGNTVSITAMPNLLSLVKFLQHSGINPSGLSVRSIMGSQSSLKSVMKLA